MADESETPPLVDAHVHVFRSDMPVMPDAWTRLDYAFPTEALIALLDAHGVRHAVVSGLSIAGTYNDYTLAAVRAHPRLRGTVIVDPTATPEALRAMRDDGIVGMRLQLARHGALPDFRSVPYRRLLAQARDLGWHVHLAIEGPRLPPVMAALLESGIDVVIDHFGHPDPADPLNCAGYRAMIAAVDSGRLWIKLAAGFRLPGTEAWRTDPAGDLDAVADRVAADLLARVGPERLLWGSDTPFVGYERRVSYARVLESYRRWVPDPAVRAAIDRTALALYFS
ncbi:MAG TPA: amidohydrolase family protein [Sphingobium sp.]|nr:amidohydrolase family protein [Sphingobium sp.]